MQHWRTLARSTVLDYNKFLTVESHTVELPDGRVIDDWAWVRTPDYVKDEVETIKMRIKRAAKRHDVEIESD